MNYAVPQTKAQEPDSQPPRGRHSAGSHVSDREWVVRYLRFIYDLGRYGNSTDALDLIIERTRRIGKHELTGPLTFSTDQLQGAINYIHTGRNAPP
jgi:hypothetical protein